MCLISILEFLNHKVFICWTHVNHFTYLPFVLYLRPSHWLSSLLGSVQSKLPLYPIPIHRPHFNTMSMLSRSTLSRTNLCLFHNSFAKENSYFEKRLEVLGKMGTVLPFGGKFSTPFLLFTFLDDQAAPQLHMCRQSSPRCRVTPSPPPPPPQGHFLKADFGPFYLAISRNPSYVQAKQSAVSCDPPLPLPPPPRRRDKWSQDSMHPPRWASFCLSTSRPILKSSNSHFQSSFQSIPKKHPNSKLIFIYIILKSECTQITLILCYCLYWILKKTSFNQKKPNWIF